MLLLGLYVQDRAFEVVCMLQVYDSSLGVMASIKKDNIGLVSRFICLNSERQRQPIKLACLKYCSVKRKYGLFKETLVIS